MSSFRRALAVFCVTAVIARPVPKYTINLDLKPEHRYDDLFEVPENQFNATIWELYQLYQALPPLTNLLRDIVTQRGPENDEQQREIEGLARLTSTPVWFLQSVQMLYELSTLFVPPVLNFTTHEAFDSKKAVVALPEGYEALGLLPWAPWGKSPGCTGIIATGADNTVYHARNLDLPPIKIMLPLLFDAIFTKGDQEIFRAQMMAGYTMVVTGATSSAFSSATAVEATDGWAVERNTRFADHWGQAQETLGNLLDGRPLNGWVLRMTFMATRKYDDAVAMLRSVGYASTEYAIVSGVRKGTVLARDPNNVKHAMTLGELNFEQRSDYIIMTNFDFYWHDIREYFDPTGGYGIGHPRRIEAQKMLNATAVGSLTGEYLFEVLSSTGDFSDSTIFQAIINVEKGIWNTSIPDLWDA